MFFLQEQQFRVLAGLTEKAGVGSGPPSSIAILLFKKSLCEGPESNEMLLVVFPQRLFTEPGSPSSGHFINS